MLRLDGTGLVSFDCGRFYKRLASSMYVLYYYIIKVLRPYETASNISAGIDNRKIVKPSRVSASTND